MVSGNWHNFRTNAGETKYYTNKIQVYEKNT